jgi:hypothetical protein
MNLIGKTLTILANKKLEKQGIKLREGTNTFSTFDRKVKKDPFLVVRKETLTLDEVKLILDMKKSRNFLHIPF